MSDDPNEPKRPARISMIPPSMRSPRGRMPSQAPGLPLSSRAPRMPSDAPISTPEIRTDAPSDPFTSGGPLSSRQLHKAPSSRAPAASRSSRAPNAREVRNSLLPGLLQMPSSVAKPNRDRIARASMPPPASTQGSLAPRLPGVAINAAESTKGSVGVVTETAQAVKRLELAQVMGQLNELGLQSLGFICLVLGFVGSILVYQAGLQALRIVPDTSNVGATYLELLVKDLAASITGLMLATRVGAGIAAEIGSMKVTDQLDALRLCRTDPVDYLIAPRVVASLIATPLLTLFGGAVAVLTGATTGYWAFGINPTIFLDPRHIDLIDWVVGFSKSVCFGFAIPLVSAHSGLYTSGGSEGVGNATTRAVVGSSLAVIIVGFFIGALAQVFFG